MLLRLFILLPHLLKLFVDGGYKQGVDWAKKLFGYCLEVVKQPDVPQFVVLPKRWIVERTFSWLILAPKALQGLRTCPPGPPEAMVYIASSSIMLRKLHPCEQRLITTVVDNTSLYFIWIVCRARLVMGEAWQDEWEGDARDWEAAWAEWVAELGGYAKRFETREWLAAYLQGCWVGWNDAIVGSWRKHG